MFSLPQSRNRNIAVFYWLSIFNNAFFVSGNWLFLWLRFMTYGQLGWIDASCFAFGMVMEIPTGAISDLVGKKVTLALACLLAGIGFVGMGAAWLPWHFLVGFLITQAGWAFYSGAAEAMAYDTLKEQNQQSSFDQVITTSSMLGTVMFVFSALAGVVLYQWHPRLPHFALAAAYGIAWFLTFFLHEPKVDTDHFSLKKYVRQLSQGAKQLWQPTLRPLLLLVFLLLGISYMFNYGFVKPAIGEYFGLYAQEQGIILALLTLVSVGLVKFVPWLRQHLNDLQGLLILNVILGAGFVLAGLTTGWWGIVVLFLIVAAGSLATPWVSVIVNREIASEYRATTLSTVSMLTKIPYVLAAVVAGKLIQDGHLVAFNLAVGLTLFSVVIVSFVALKQLLNAKVETIG